jgi:uncharacterized protein
LAKNLLDLYKQSINMIHKNIQMLLPKAIELFSSHKVKDAYLFGSAINKNFNESSDIDFEINFKDDLNPIEKGDLWWDLYEKLRENFQREVDIVSQKSLKNPYFIKSLNESKIKIFG